jgi:hypothetical protein
MANQQQILRQTKVGHSYVYLFPASQATVPFNQVVALSSSYYSASYCGALTLQNTGSWNISLYNTYEYSVTDFVDTTANLYLLNSTTKAVLASGTNGSLSYNVPTGSSSASCILVVTHDQRVTNPNFRQYKLEVLHTSSAVVPMAITSALSVNTTANTITITTPNTESTAMYRLIPSGSGVMLSNPTAWYPYGGTISYESTLVGTVYVKTMRDGQRESTVVTASYF